MKRYLLLLSACLMLSALSAQVRSAAPKNELRGLVPDKWVVQHYHTAWDGRAMVLSALTPGQNQYDLYVLTCYRGAWSKPERLGASVNSDENEYWPNLAPDGQTLYFVRETPARSRKEETRYTLMMAARDGADWRPAEALIISEGQDVSPYMLEDGCTMLLARAERRPETRQQQYGLYRMVRLDKVNWTEPTLLLSPDERDMHYYGFSLQGQHIRYTIESATHRDTTCYLGEYDLPDSLRRMPVMVVSGKTTKADGKLLDADIRVRDGVTGVLLATYRTDGQYRLVLPAQRKYTIEFAGENTNHYYLEPDCRTLQKDSALTYDLRFESTLHIALNVYDALDNTLLTNTTHHLPIGTEHRLPVSRRAYADTTIVIDTRNTVLLTESELDLTLMPGTAPLTILVRDAETDSLIERRDMLVRQGQSYPMHFEAVGYAYADTTILVPMRSDSLILTVPLRTLRADMIMQLRNIQFEYNSAELMEESFEELDKVVRLMSLNADLRIELAAHTDDLGTDTYNDRLSTRRGERAKAYLVAHGISANRIEARGYGKRRPLVPNDSDEHRAQNRRVEFKVLGL